MSKEIVGDISGTGVSTTRAQPVNEIQAQPVLTHTHIFARLSDQLMDHPIKEVGLWVDPLKVEFGSALMHALQAVRHVRSITLTGSFVDHTDLSGISDIDTIVIVERLTTAKFNECCNAVAGLDCTRLGGPASRLHLNTTFGPLKFDEPGRVVVHLMIYSVADHRTHVLKSPFTCLDWERSAVHVGPSLREIYPVLALQPRQLLESRRGLSDYLDDLTAGAIRFRRYEIDGENIREVTDRQPLDSRHQGEYAYHIVRNLVSNYAKLVRRTNTRLSTDELLAFWREALPRCAEFCEWFVALETRKRARAHDYPPGTLARTRDFLLTFSEEIEHTWRKRAVRHAFIRHGKTALNDGSFLGQHRDPGILPDPIAALNREFAHVFSSPARRCRETAGRLQPTGNITVDPRLHEINYGSAEGLTFPQLAATHPELVAGWGRGEDPPFQGGENTADVSRRLTDFITSLPDAPSLVVSHNVVLRCLLGSGLGVPMTQWHLVPVPHGEPIEVLRLDGRTYLDLSPAQLATITDAVAGYRPQ